MRVLGNHLLCVERLHRGLLLSARWILGDGLDRDTEQPRDLRVLGNLRRILRDRVIDVVSDLGDLPMQKLISIGLLGRGCRLLAGIVLGGRAQKIGCIGHYFCPLFCLNQ